ncbi:MAG: protein phosphatase CheZ [Alphaproteobacteria bacterium]|nr:protein phosphatase CheZ [Alphaproteobacteria bacterium]
MPDGTLSGADPVERAVRSVLSSIAGDLSANETLLLGELQGLAEEIARAKREMAALKVVDINASHIPVATDELDAVVSHTAEATNEILDACEGLERLAPRLSAEDAGAVSAAVTRIFEACSFQDITGQRIGKVVNALKSIEDRLKHVEERFGPFPDHAPPPAAATVVPEGRALANGPQLPSGAASQAEIDSLLASFD